VNVLENTELDAIFTLKDGIAG